MKTSISSDDSLRIKLIFNPSAGPGSPQTPPDRLMEVIRELQDWHFIPEVLLINPDVDVPAAIEDALARGIQMFVVCGGDGTISSTARSLVGSEAVLGIIPQGTQNNTALSLGIPSAIPEAVALFRNGSILKMDVGMAQCGETTLPFLEFCSVGLVSELFPSADDIQHGKVGQIGEFLTTLVSSPPANIHLMMDDGQEIQNEGYVLLVTNIPYVGLNYHLGPEASYKDGLLDVLYFADLNKMDLLNYVFQGADQEVPKDSRIQQYHVRQIEVITNPEMQVMVDGTTMGEGRVRIEVQPGALSIIVPSDVAEKKPEIEGKEEFVDVDSPGA